MSGQSSSDPLTLAAGIVTAHVAHNRVEVDEVPALIQAVYRSLISVTQPPASEPAGAPKPAVPIKRSVFPDYIVCLEDGKKLKMLKRHLKTSYDMTPDDYRAKWGLPREYPMVAPNYAAHRSGLAKQIGLGRKATASPAEPPPPAPGDKPAAPETSGRRGRKPKAAA